MLLVCFSSSCSPSRPALFLAGPAAVVHCPNGVHKFMNESVGKGVYEVIGTLGNDGSLTEMQACYFGDNFDLNMYAEMVQLSHQFPDIF